VITWILLGVLIFWCIYQRTRPDGKVEGKPLGMPRGTVRAVITILIVSFPLQYLIFDLSIPGLIINALFIVVAFYFEARKPSEDRLKRILKEIRKPEKIEEEERREKLPLYLPKYSVRFILILMLALIIILNVTRPSPTSFSATSTIIDIMLIIGLYMVGSLFRGIGVSRERKNIKEQISTMKDHESLSKYEIIEKLMEYKVSWWKRKGKSFLSLFMLASVVFSLFVYSFKFDIPLLITPIYTLTLQGTLLLLINMYYGIRD
jgi:hypothetical protein